MSRFKLTEVAESFFPTQWVDMSLYREYAAFANTVATSPLNAVTIQIRKAVSAAGGDAEDHGDPVSADNKASVSVLAEDLGATSAGVPFTHVSFVLTDDASPNEAFGVGIGIRARFPS